VNCGFLSLRAWPRGPAVGPYATASGHRGEQGEQAPAGGLVGGEACRARDGLRDVDDRETRVQSVTESLMEVSDQDISGKWQDA
jgi:hypothetical protein